MKNQTKEKIVGNFLSQIISYFTQQTNHLKVMSRNSNFWIILCVDILSLIVAHILSYFIRFDFSFTELTTSYLVIIYPLLLVVKIPVFYFCGLYSGMWRYTSIRDLNNIIKAISLSSIIIIVLVLYLNRFQGVSRSVFILDSLFSFLFVCASRITIRGVISSTMNWVSIPEDEKDKLLLVGAGDAAEKIIREVRENKQLPFLIVGCVDDDLKKVGKNIHGIPVLGTLSELSTHLEVVGADELLIAIASASGIQMKRIVEICQATGFPFKVIPGLGELIDGKVSVKAMRDISFKDLLGRDMVYLDQERIGSYITGKTVLVTGAGGSIGSELCRQLIRFSPSHLILFDASEENLYAIQMELQHELKFFNFATILGRIQSEGLLDSVFYKHRPEVVFHAAAYKHVPLIEENPWEAVLNNIGATQKLIEASIHHKVARFVLVSTDKAVRPANVMGASKRITELLLLAYGKQCLNASAKDSTLNHRTIFQAVRFGNVLGSSGSVIPLFKRQIELGGPVTVTHPEITRYFMSIEEAAQLIIQAGAMGSGNEIFILKMGEPIKIAKMARDLIILAGHEPDTEIEIQYIGLRKGEKLYEELITAGEGIVETNHGKIMVLHSNGNPMENILSTVDVLLESARVQDGKAIREHMKTVVPEFVTTHHV